VWASTLPAFYLAGRSQENVHGSEPQASAADPVGFMSKLMMEAVGTSSRSTCNRLGSSKMTKSVTPVALPLGLLRLATRPSLTGSSPVANTIGIDAVAAFAARAENAAPAVTRTAT
jgi:hypothetical protein